MNTSIKEFLEWKGTYTVRAKKAYAGPLKKLVSFTTNIPLHEFKYETYLRFYNTLNERYPASYVAYCITILREFLRYHEFEGFPLSRIRIPRYQNRRRKVAKLEQYQDIVKRLDVMTYSGLMKRVMFGLLWETGLRVSELIALNISDFENENHTVITTAKANRRRVIAWSDELHKELMRYIALRISVGSGDALFVNYAEKKRLTTRSVQRWIKEFNLDITCHSFRHGKAHEMIRQGAGIKEIATVLGHSELNSRSALQYLRLDVEEMLSIVKKFIP